MPDLIGLAERARLDEQRRKAITEWWERKALRDFIARIRARATKEIHDGTE